MFARSFAPAPLSPVGRPAAAGAMLPHSCAALAVLVVVVAAAVGAEAPAAAQQPGQALRQKRYVAALARNGDLPFSVRREWHKKLHPAVSAHRGLQAALAPAPNPLGIPGKRYVGALARGGQLPGKRAGDEPEDPIDREMEQLLLEELEAMDELQAAEQQLQRLQEVEDKRSLASLARGGQLPGKRFNDFRDEEDEEDEDMKRGISTLAKNGQLPAPLTPGDNRSEDEGAEQKRGGVSALARLGYLPPHKKDLDWLLASLQNQQAFAPAEEKRNIGSLARGFSLPPPGKRNLGALARGGGFSALRYAGSKKNDILDAAEAEKRSAASLAQHGLPLGKRFHPLTFGQEERFWHPPQRPGKRSEGEGDGVAEDALEDAEDITKRYVAALLRQGRLPVGGPGGPSPFAAASFADAAGHDDADADQLDEEKRHLGALRRISREAAPARAKRQASDEFALPVFQPSDAQPADLDDALLQRVLMAGEDAPGAADKRFLGPPPAPFAVAAAGPPPPPPPFGPDPAAAALALAKRHIGALARLGWLPAFHAGTPGERVGRFGKRHRSHPADEPQPGALAAAGGDRATGAAAFPQHLSAEARAIRRLLARRREQLQLQRYNRIRLPHVVQWRR